MRLIDADALTNKVNKHNNSEWGQRICYCGYPVCVPNNRGNSLNNCRKRKKRNDAFS